MTLLPFASGDRPFTPLAAKPAGDERKNNGEDVGTRSGCGVNREDPFSFCDCVASERSCWPGLDKAGEL